jgi:phage-related protein
MNTGETSKPLFWMGSSRRELKDFPVEVRRLMGFALWQAQSKRKHPDAKPLKGFGGAGVLEVVGDHDGSTYRAVYTVKFAGCRVGASRLSEEVEERDQNPEAGAGTCPKAAQDGGGTLCGMACGPRE